jgi:hypothetical protein
VVPFPTAADRAHARPHRPAEPAPQTTIEGALLREFRSLDAGGQEAVVQVIAGMNRTRGQAPRPDTDRPGRCQRGGSDGARRDGHTRGTSDLSTAYHLEYHRRQQRPACGRAKCRFRLFC